MRYILNTVNSFIHYSTMKLIRKILNVVMFCIMCGSLIPIYYGCSHDINTQADKDAVLNAYMIAVFMFFGPIVYFASMKLSDDKFSIIDEIAGNRTNLNITVTFKENPDK